MRKTLTGEAAVSRAVDDLLGAYRIPHWRMNAGNRYVQSAKGKGYCIKGQELGTGDWLAAPNRYARLNPATADPFFLWIECKSETGKQTPGQYEFQQRMEAQGHFYIIARSSDDVLAKLRELGCTSTESNPVKLPRVRVKAPF